MSEETPTNFVEKWQGEPKFIKGGRGKPFKVTPHDLKLIRFMYKQGFTDREIAKELEIHQTSLKRFVMAHDELREEIRVWKQAATDRVEAAVYKSALGFHEVEQKPMVVKVDKFQEEIQIVEYERYHPPNVNAGRFWLKNKRGKDWKDTKTIEVGKIEKMSDQDLEAEAKKFLLEEANEEMDH